MKSSYCIPSTQVTQITVLWSLFTPPPKKKQPLKVNMLHIETQLTEALGVWVFIIWGDQWGGVVFAASVACGLCWPTGSSCPYAPSLGHSVAFITCLTTYWILSFLTLGLSLEKSISALMECEYLYTIQASTGRLGQHLLNDFNSNIYYLKI